VNRAAVANRAWLTINRVAHRRFVRALSDVRRTQEGVLRRTLRRNADTAYGREHGFSAIRTADEFRARVPLVTYDDIHPYVERIAAGERGVLTREAVKLFEPSSGSTRAAKWIPYTAELQAELQRAVAPWVSSLFLERPKLMDGPAYWSITPSVETRGRGSVIPVGFEEDSAYLGGICQRLVAATFAVPPDVRHLRDPEELRRVTLRHLTACRALRLISVWHPSYLSWLLAPLAGKDLRTIWPELSLVSCWADGHAALHLDEVGRLLPGVEIQPKGLIATEGIVSIPYGRRRPLAVTSHFLEFLDEEGAVRAAWEVEEGGKYSVVLTTGGGLYRYRLHDRVEVTRFLETAPCLRFLGKEDHVSDRFGEKLSEGFVAGVLARLLSPGDVAFAMLSAEENASGTRYVLWVEGVTPPDGLAGALERELAANPHYAYCRRIGQLGRAAVQPVGRGAYERYAERLRARGQRLGDVKASALSTLSGWDLFLQTPGGAR
jgi:hypothetical protein